MLRKGITRYKEDKIELYSLRLKRSTTNKEVTRKKVIGNV